MTRMLFQNYEELVEETLQSDSANEADFSDENVQADEDSEFEDPGFKKVLMSYYRSFKPKSSFELDAELEDDFFG
ncbi:hypothetical protein CWC29_004360 [Pseudoalteromonas sp. S4498]|uniref:Uncharacterized protein n=1 Tax=Pseudoalteromonas galatheae TaxID=579562 RepID=A0A8T6YPT3_9GAMM|nr:hypothetical protein [Pseudoalteromonas galatheae]NKC18076.1 hypothetical protein [Pseudoalteromonas galatheae]